MPFTALVGVDVAGVVVLVVVVVVDVDVDVDVDVVLGGWVEVVVLLVVATEGSVVALGDADLLDVTGLIGVDLDPGAGDGARLLARVSELGDPIDNAVGTVDGPMVGGSALATPEENALPPVDVSGATGPLVVTGGELGEPESSARNTKINTMPTTPAIPIPFCKVRRVTTYLKSSG